ncbi:alpha/beta fold hydrolase [Planctomonas sp. JC2975]|uniref:alpha/beta fold hydrolase n=1 Tax=Planctomonas sp. JC2975 TaxID=2729626 RepID=UPI0014752B34|nr:alpha/beta fold hydrolase [Planctomonas sp. JC2975]NNC12130.1 alpha/beta fold hydrolase [Planctomonas sp. JC2975]
MTQRLFTLADGRRIGITVRGAQAAMRWVLMCHPTPGAGGFDPDPHLTERSGLSVISLDRPGYGASDPWRVPPQPSPLRWVEDVDAFLAQCRSDAESLGRVAYRDLAVLGWREGSIFAAAFAAAFRDEVAAVALVEPMTLRAASYGTETSAVWAGERLAPDVGAADSRDPGLTSRLERMLSTAAEQGDAGLDADRAAFKQKVLRESLDSVTAPTLVLARNTKQQRRSAHAYARRLRDVRVALSNAEVPIAAHWAGIITHLQAFGARG